MEELRHKLIVSCQALPDEPLHSDFIMARMAVAAEEGEHLEFAPILLLILQRFEKR